jgi:hypothetical protein
MAKGQQRDGRREAFWREALARQRQSGLNVRLWCSRERMPETTFYFWRRTIAQRDCDAVRIGTPAFVPVMLEPPRRLGQPGRITIRLLGGRVMRLPPGMDVRQIAELVRSIESQPAQAEGVAS